MLAIQKDEKNKQALSASRNSRQQQKKGKKFNSQEVKILQ